MAAKLTCPHCGKNTTVADIMHPGRCACGLSLAGAPAAHIASNSKVVEPEPPPQVDPADEPPPFTVPPSLTTVFLEPTPRGAKAPQTPSAEVAPEPKPKLTVARREPDPPPTPPIVEPMPAPVEAQPPEPPAPLDEPIAPIRTKADVPSCPSCQASVSTGSVICTNCGYSFKTGKAVEATAQEADEEPSPEDFGYETPEEDEGPSLFQRIKPLIKLAVFAIILGGIGAIVFYSLQSRYGVSSENPLGTPAKVQAYFKSVGLEKDANNPKPFGSCKRIRYTNPILEKDTKGKFRESIFLVLDKDDKFVGLGADFWATDMPSGTRVQGFLHSYWKEIGGKPGGEEIETPVIKATWNKGSGPMSLGPVHQEDVRIIIKGSAFEKEEAERRKMMRENRPIMPIMIP